MRALTLGLLLAGCGPRAGAPPVESSALSEANSTPEGRAAEPTPSPGAACCAECVAASQKDPQARDLSLFACRGYGGELINGAPALSPTCVAWFAERPTTVGECR